jgi:hypothetical protein
MSQPDLPELHHLDAIAQNGGRLAVRMPGRHRRNSQPETELKNGAKQEDKMTANQIA